MDDLVSGAGVVNTVRLDKLILRFGSHHMPHSSWRQAAVLGVLALAMLHFAGQSRAADASAGLRIVTLAPNLTELVYAAGAGDQLVGVVEYSDFPAVALELPRIGDAFRIDYEALQLLEPDLILTWQSGNPSGVVRRLQELGYRIEEFETSSLEDIATQIERIGRLAGTTATADTIAKQFRVDVAKLRNQYRGAQALRVFYQISAQPYFTISDRHVINELLELCGGSNVFADLKAVAPGVTLESVILANPEVIIAPVVAGADGWQQGWQSWQSVSAVRAGALYNVEADYISRSTTRILRGAQQLCAALEAARQVYAGAN